MLSEQLAPCGSLQNGNTTVTLNGSVKDGYIFTGLDTFENQDTTIYSMTKQLASTISASSVSISTLAPAAISPTSALRKSTNNVPFSQSQSNTTNTITTGNPVNSLAAGGSTTAVSNNDTSGRSAALERAYVHDVYENCEEPSGPIRPRVAQFLSNLDPGSVVCDVGCGSGRYLTQCNPLICTIGVDRCHRLSKVAREKGGEVALCDNLELPFRDESFDAVLSLAVVHHFATTERRISALRELARILRVGGRVIITVWALEQRHRRFESQDVLIPWQPPKNRDFSYSDEEDDDDFLPPYHAYTEDSTNSSRSAGDGDSSSLSSSSPGESCYSFVRRAIQKLAGGRKHPWFLDSWTSKDTKNDSSLDYEDAKDLPIELRRLEDFEDFPDPPLSAGLKSRSLGSILNPPPRQIVRSRSSVPSLGGPLLHGADSVVYKNSTIQNAQLLNALDGHNGATGHSPTHMISGTNHSANSSISRRPKLIKQKQSLCDEDSQQTDTSFRMISSFNSSSVNTSFYLRNAGVSGSNPYGHHPPLSARQLAQASLFLRKQSSLNEELMAGNRIREKERVRKRIQKQMSLNEAFLCRSALFSKRLQVIREGFTTKIKSSTGSLERVTKNSLNKIMQNLKGPHGEGQGSRPGGSTEQNNSQQLNNQCQYHQNHHHHHHQQQLNGGQKYQTHYPHFLYKQFSISSTFNTNKYAGPVTYCNNPDCVSSGCYCSSYHHTCSSCSNDTNDSDTKTRRHSRESGSDSSKDSSLQSDTSIESEDSFASVIFIPKPEQHQQQLNYQQQHQNSNSSSSNSSSSNGGCQACNNCCQSKNTNNNACHHKNCQTGCTQINGLQQHHHRMPSVPTSPLIMPCPPTPAHSPAAAQATITSPPQSVAAVTAAMAILTPPSKPKSTATSTPTSSPLVENTSSKIQKSNSCKSQFIFDEAHIKKQQETQIDIEKETKVNRKQQEHFEKEKITRQTIRDLPPIPKFRKQQSLQFHRQSFPIVRRSSAVSGCGSSTLPKLLSLELFNPATDDLDSDSSEPSSPDSIDSVISIPRSAAPITGPSEEPQNESNGSPSYEDEDFQRNIKIKQQLYHNGDLKINPSIPNDIILNEEESYVFSKHPKINEKPTKIQPDCTEFAEQLNAQLLRELEDKKNPVEFRSLDSVGDINDFLDTAEQVSKKRNGIAESARDLNSLREELRERRLMLANLSTQPSPQQTPNSSSTSSLSSQTSSSSSPSSSLVRISANLRKLKKKKLWSNSEILRSSTVDKKADTEQKSALGTISRSIQNQHLRKLTAFFTNDEEEYDEEESEKLCALRLYENCKMSKFNYNRNRLYNPETAYLIQDDGDSSIRDDDENDEIEHNVILEEDEDALAAEDMETDHNDSDNNSGKCPTQFNVSTRKLGNQKVITCNSNDNEIYCDQNESNEEYIQHSKEPANNIEHNVQQSTESWEHSNSSTASLDSPSQGGATTHHRYYHVFREGELDALINNHVQSLHIVSSYYERASWCVVAEKVQVWTI